MEQDRTWLAHALGMKLAEIVDAVDAGDDWIVTTHDGQRVRVAEDGTVSPFVPKEIHVEYTEPASEELSEPDGDDQDGDRDDDAVPNGTVDDVLAWVGDDRDRATRALQAEQAGKKRASLTAQLERLANLA